MAKYPFGAPGIEQIDPPAGEGFYIRPPRTGAPATDSELERLTVVLQKKGEVRKTAVQFYDVATYGARVTRFAVQNQWNEGTYRVLYRRARTNQSPYSQAVTVKWPVES